ncbi:hypothetical protein [Photobacterium leiognathi]|uniref:hypothetical protein n=1 Tax=Photobacterium leiognathi TaxID=553611 RepID=UPI002980C90F|nr:hypothetical protein [Photobacterium leiognathi]
MKFLTNSIITFSLFFAINIAHAQECVPIDSGIVYTISPNVDVCLDTQEPVTLINSYELNTSMFSIQSVDAQDTQMMFPDEWVHISGTFTIKLTKEMYAYRNKNIVLLMDKDEIIRSFTPMNYMAKAPVGTGAAITAGITSANEGSHSAANNVVGAVAGHVVGAAVIAGTKSPVAGEIAAGVAAKMVTDKLNNHKAQTHPSITRGGNMGNFGGGHGGAAGGGNCISCHPR